VGGSCESPRTVQGVCPGVRIPITPRGTIYERDTEEDMIAKVTELRAEGKTDHPVRSQLKPPAEPS